MPRERRRGDRRQEDRINALEVAQAVHSGTLIDHERVLTALEGHLASLVNQIQSLERKCLIAASVLFVTSAHATNFIHTIAGWL